MIKDCTIIFYATLKQNMSKKRLMHFKKPHLLSSENPTVCCIQSHRQCCGDEGLNSNAKRLLQVARNKCSEHLGIIGRTGSPGRHNFSWFDKVVILNLTVDHGTVEVNEVDSKCFFLTPSSPALSFYLIFTKLLVIQV